MKLLLESLWLLSVLWLIEFGQKAIDSGHIFIGLALCFIGGMSAWIAIDKAVRK